MPNTNDLIVEKLRAVYPTLTTIGDLLHAFKADEGVPWLTKEYYAANGGTGTTYGDLAWTFWNNFTADQSISVPAGWGDASWKAARDGAAITPGIVVVFGHSIPQGYYSSHLATASYPGQLSTLLQAEHGDGGSGFHSLRNATGIGATGSTYITLAGAYAATSVSTINETSRSVSALGTGRSVTTPGVRGTAVDLWWLRNVSLSTGFDYNIDAGVATGTTLDAAAGTGVISASVAVPAGTHSVVQNSRADRWMILTGVTGRNATGIVVHNMGFAGRFSAACTVTTNLSGGKNSGDVTITDFGPHLVIIDVGINDIVGAVTKATFKANVERLIVDAAGADVILVLSHRGNTADASNLYTQYEEAVYEIQTALDPQVAVYNAWVDGGKDWQTWRDLDYWGITNSATGNPGDDPVHLSDLGHAHMASKLMEIANAA